MAPLVEKNMGDHLKVFGTLMGLLNARGVEPVAQQSVAHITQPSGRRIQRGYEVTRLIIRPLDQHGKTGESRMGSARRLHYVRGYWRHRPRAKWVQGYFRGDQSVGTLLHDEIVVKA